MQRVEIIRLKIKGHLWLTIVFDLAGSVFPSSPIDADLTPEVAPSNWTRR